MAGALVSIRDTALKKITRKQDKPFDSENGLVGRFFHSLDSNSQVEWQGYVRAWIEPGWYVVQLFEYAGGEPNIQRVVTIQQMSGWIFYQDGEEMVHSYDYGACRYGGPFRKKIPTP